MLKVAWSPVYAHPLPEGHRFPMEKYNLIPEQLLYEGTLTQANFFEPAIQSEEDILTTHSAEYFRKLQTQTLTTKEARKFAQCLRSLGPPFMPIPFLRATDFRWRSTI
jgi:acetoin utilization deacetylase AcuC-like enzyme